MQNETELEKNVLGRLAQKRIVIWKKLVPGNGHGPGRAKFFVAFLLRLVRGKSSADEKQQAELDLAVIDRDAEVSGSLQNVFHAFDLAADEFLAVERKEDREDVVHALGIGRVIAEIVRYKVALRKIVGNGPESLWLMGGQVFV